MDDLLQAADRLDSDGHPIGPSRTTAELQYAIYPWTFKGEPQAILDVTGHPGDLAATDIIGSNLEIHGTTAGELVTQVSSLLGEKPRAIFRWVKKVSELMDTE